MNHQSPSPSAQSEKIPSVNAELKECKVNNFEAFKEYLQKYVKTGGGGYMMGADVQKGGGESVLAYSNEFEKLDPNSKDFCYKFNNLFKRLPPQVHEQFLEDEKFESPYTRKQHEALVRKQPLTPQKFSDMLHWVNKQGTDIHKIAAVVKGKNISPDQIRQLKILIGNDAVYEKILEINAGAAAVSKVDRMKRTVNERKKLENEVSGNKLPKALNPTQELVFQALQAPLVQKFSEVYQSLQNGSMTKEGLSQFLTGVAENLPHIRAKLGNPAQAQILQKIEQVIIQQVTPLRAQLASMGVKIDKNTTIDEVFSSLSQKVGDIDNKAFAQTAAVSPAGLKQKPGEKPKDFTSFLAGNAEMAPKAAREQMTEIIAEFPELRESKDLSPANVRGVVGSYLKRALQEVKSKGLEMAQKQAAAKAAGNTGKKGAKLSKVFGMLSSGFDGSKLPETARMVNSAFNLKGSFQSLYEAYQKGDMATAQALEKQIQAGILGADGKSGTLNQYVASIKPGETGKQVVESFIAKNYKKFIKAIPDHEINSTNAQTYMAALEAGETAKSYAEYIEEDVLGKMNSMEKMLYQIGNLIGRLMAFLRPGDKRAKDAKAQKSALEGFDRYKDMNFSSGFFGKYGPIIKNTKITGGDGNPLDFRTYFSGKNVKENLEQMTKIMEAAQKDPTTIGTLTTKNLSVATWDKILKAQKEGVTFSLDSKDQNKLNVTLANGYIDTIDLGGKKVDKTIVTTLVSTARLAQGLNQSPAEVLFFKKYLDASPDVQTVIDAFITENPKDPPAKQQADKDNLQKIVQDPNTYFNQAKFLAPFTGSGKLSSVDRVMDLGQRGFENSGLPKKHFENFLKLSAFKKIKVEQITWYLEAIKNNKLSGVHMTGGNKIEADGSSYVWDATFKTPEKFFDWLKKQQ